MLATVALENCLIRDDIGDARSSISYVLTLKVIGIDDEQRVDTQVFFPSSSFNLSHSPNNQSKLFDSAVSSTVSVFILSFLL